MREGGSTKDLRELSSIVVDQADPVHNDVVHAPIAGLIQQPVIQRDLGLPRLDLGAHLGIVPLKPLIEILHLLAGIPSNLVSVGTGQERSKEIDKLPPFRVTEFRPMCSQSPLSHFLIVEPRTNG